MLAGMDPLSASRATQAKSTVGGIAASGQHGRFDQELAHHTPSIRAHGQTHRDVALPLRAAREEQVHDIGAADDQHEEGGRLPQGEDRRDAGVEHPVGEGVDADAAVAIGGRILLLEPLGDDGHLGPRLFQ